MVWWEWGCVTSFLRPSPRVPNEMSSSQADELQSLRAEVERLRGRLHEVEAEAGSARYRQIVESAIDFAVIALDLEGRVTHWNEGARRTLGWTREEMRGELAHVFFTEEDRARHMPEDEMHRALRDGSATDERWHLRKDGTRFWGSGEMMPLKDEAGTLLGFVKILRDRTRQHVLGQERERFLMLAEQSTDFVGLADVDGVGLFINQAGRALLGVSETALEGITILDCFAPEERPFVEQVVLPAQRSLGHWRGEMHLVNQRTGALIPVDYNGFVLRDAQGHITAYATVTRDLSEAKRAESSLRRSEEHLQLVLKSTGSLCIWDWDMRADRFQLDERFARLFGMASESGGAGLKASAFLPGIHPEDRERVRAAIRHAVERGEDFNCEYRVTPDSGVRWLHSQGRLFQIGRAHV